MDIYQHALDEHARLRGKISISLRATPDNRDALSAFYSPGVAEVSRVIAGDHSLLQKYTWTNNLVAVISDGSAVLGLGDIGPEAAMPVMEGKAMLFKHFGNVDAVPIILDVHEPDEIINTIKAISKSFGAINLEDIASPKCFEIEDRLKNELAIPIMHDDQHGTAIVVLAGIINATKVVGKRLQECKVVLIGAGAAGTAIAKLLTLYQHPEIVTVDSKGVILADREDMSLEKEYLSSLNYLATGRTYTLQDVLINADIVIGVSKAGMLTAEDIKLMNNDAIVFALANPEPEILPEIAISAGARVVATGRSDLPNQINNVLAFPGIFRGALDSGIKQITDDHKLAAAMAIAGLVKNPGPENIIPSVLDPNVCRVVAESVR